MKTRDFEPKLVSVLREGYSAKEFLQDALAGIVVGIIALPLAIAFAIASGVRPEQGLYTAIVAGFLISALGGSRVQIGGPTGAFIVIVYGIVHEYGYDGLAVATLLAGALLVCLGLARLGAVIQFIPYPVTIGFTTGIAIIIASGQIRDGLGLEMESIPPEFIHKLAAYAEHAGEIHPWSLSLFAFTVLLISLWPRVSNRVPGPLIALVATTAAVQLFKLPVETIASRFGSVPTSLPMPSIPHIDIALIPKLISPALSIALLGGIESLLSAVVADGMTGRRHRSNMELVAQGIANLASPLFGGIPATGAIARTAANVKNGGRTPFAGIIHSLTLLVILLFAGKWAAMIPMATLAGILVVVAYNMSEWRVFVSLFRGPRSDVLVLLSTFALTILIDLTVAIQVGVVLAALLFMRRMADVTKVRAITDALEGVDGEGPEAPRMKIPAEVEVYEISGSFFFGAAQKFSETISHMKKPKVVILQMKDVIVMDATGMRALEEVMHRFRKLGIHLLLAGVHSQPLVVLQNAGLIEKIGLDNLPGSLIEAIERAEELIRTGAMPPKATQTHAGH